MRRPNYHKNEGLIEGWPTLSVLLMHLQLNHQQKVSNMLNNQLIISSIYPKFESKF
jgi:hypothetical protein